MNNIKEIVYQVIEDFKFGLQGICGDNFVNQSLYIAIDEEGDCKVSMCSNILAEAHEAILILVHDVVAYTNSYFWYRVYYINKDGEVTIDFKNNKFKISSYCSGKYIDQNIGLYYNDTKINSFEINHTTWTYEFKKLWESYKIAKNCSTLEDMRLAISLYYRNLLLAEYSEKIDVLQLHEKLLEYQIKKYRDMLDELRDILDNYKK